jgi:hypothetical protein
MAGRKLKVLPADGSARTELVRRLRELKKQAGDPTYAEISKRTGYSRTALSGLFNAEKLPSPELLHDVVEWLHGVPAEWEERRARAQREEEQPSPDPATLEMKGALERARQENAALRLMIASPDDATYWTERNMLAADEQMRHALRTETHAKELLAQVLARLDQLAEIRSDVERRCNELMETAAKQAALVEERARLDANETARTAQDEADLLIRRAQAQAARIQDDAQMYASSLHAKAGQAVDALLREADTAESNARRDADRLRSRARIEIERMVREAQNTFTRSGNRQAVVDLEILLTDFGIGGVHPDDDAAGRHRRIQVEPAPTRPELTA